MTAVEVPAPPLDASGWIEELLFRLAQSFQWPVMLLVLLTFAYALIKLGGFLVEGFCRLRAPADMIVLPRGAARSIEAQELFVLKELEGLRLCSRVAPMLGLVATMIPLGPALVAVAGGTSAPTMGPAAAADLGAAFAAVIVALVAASLSFAMYTVRRRWLLQELNCWIESHAGPSELHRPGEAE